ncbi:hypothetical protein PGTUg99_032469, partial [Puccinia graminis f. sp. tritici]
QSTSINPPLASLVGIQSHILRPESANSTIDTCSHQHFDRGNRLTPVATEPLELGLRQSIPTLQSRRSFEAHATDT